MRAEGEDATGGVEREPKVPGVSSGWQNEQYSLAKILVIWALATVPMGVLSWIAFPLLAPDSRSDALGFGVTRLVLLALGLVWLFVLSMIIVQRSDLGPLARAARPGGRVRSRFLASPLGRAVHGLDHLVRLRYRLHAAGDGQYLAGDRAARGLEQHHLEGLRSDDGRRRSDVVDG
jgi:hypothetical protein